MNDGMGEFVANKVVKLMIHKGLAIKDSKVLILGITFKENCPDIRNTRIVDIRRELIEFGCKVDIVDPWTSTIEVKHEFGFDLAPTSTLLNIRNYQAIIIGVAHNEFEKIGVAKSPNQVVFDLKGKIPKDHIDGRL